MKLILKRILPLILLLAVTQTVSAAANLTKLVKKIQSAVVTVVVYDINDQVANIGTGFFIDDQGHLITNYHVLVGKYSAEIKTIDGKTYSIKHIVAENESTDLIKVQVDIPNKDLKWLDISDDLPSIAERIIVVGSPMGLEQTVSEGIVSSVREIPGLGKFFQMSAPISPGSSGSPVINLKGDVIGVATFQFAQGQNLNFAISTKSVKALKPKITPVTISEWTYALSKQKPRLAAEMCQKGFSFSINGQDQKALHYFKKATERDPNDPVAWYGLGYCQAGLNNQDAAIDAYKQAIRVNPYDEATHFHLGNYYAYIGRFENAIEIFKQVISINPKFEAAHFNLGVAYAKLGKFNEGRKAFEQVIQINPASASGHYHAALAYHELGRYNDAVEANRQVIRLKPDFVAAHFNLGVVYGKLGQSDAEIAAYKEAIRIDPNFAPAHYNIGYAFLLQGNKSAALEQYKILKQLDVDAANKLFDSIYQ
jgi:tetratricopeptide (TPR) repeat protein